MPKTTAGNRLAAQHNSVQPSRPVSANATDDTDAPTKKNPERVPRRAGPELPANKRAMGGPPTDVVVPMIPDRQPAIVRDKGRGFHWPRPMALNTTANSNIAAKKTEVCEQR